MEKRVGAWNVVCALCTVQLLQAMKKHTITLSVMLAVAITFWPFESFTHVKYFENMVFMQNAQCSLDTRCRLVGHVT